MKGVPEMFEFDALLCEKKSMKNCGSSSSLMKPGNICLTLCKINWLSEEVIFALTTDSGNQSAHAHGFFLV